MADKTKIEWTDATWNPITGCSIVSPGCTNCYAMKLAGTRLKHIKSRKGLTKDTKAGPVWTGEVRFNEEWLNQPLRWKAPRMIFVCAHGDLFAEGVPDEWIDKIFTVMTLAPQHVFQVLTKRPDRMRDYCRNLPARADRLGQWAASIWGGKDPDGIYETAQETAANPLANVWLGVSVEDQTRAEERIPILLDTPAAVRWISAEPLLGPIDLANVDIDNDGSMDTINPRLWRDEWELSWQGTTDDANEALDGFLDWYGLSSIPDGFMHPTLDWVVVGGESGHGARPVQQKWVQSLRDQCAGASVPFLFKQWGEYKPTSDANGPYMAWFGKRAAGRELDGVTHDAFPEVNHGR
ncbi:protein gp37 [Phyllobacterium sp. YR620]|uniref:DUF5131 family protein n=1 Tax=Phyllobacterium sp. YR620 TaxID=1881066 RepID=UPI0008915666|nr:phage Gp37/Gp68 family protein [Phyllobacterium sp. YR620]SDP92304.1 protein gp37 [Phyllobacterium sp. YR620]